MKKITISFFLVLILLAPTLLFAQLKRDLVQPDIATTLTKPANNYLLGIFDPSRMQMHHSFSMGYSMGGGNSMLMNTYMNRIDFKLSEKLFLRTNIGIMSSPYHTFGEKSMFNEPMFFGGAELDYKVSDKTRLMLRFESTPYYYRQPYQNRYYFNQFE
jgi:hypothetical protein